MKTLSLPHRVYEASCPINGLTDQYEWKTGVRLPEYFLFFLSTIGCTYIRQKNAPAPRMVFWGSTTGKPQHEFLSDVMGYHWTCSEGGAFQTALKKAKTSIDAGLPVILGLLDMYHLPYFGRFYHKVHIPQHYILMVGYDDEQQCIYAHDNSRPEVQCVPYSDLKEAWNVNNPGQGQKNTLYVLEFDEHIPTQEEIVRNGLRKRARVFLNPPVGFAGVAGMRKLAADFNRWPTELNETQFEASLRHLVTFTCSVLPLPPARLLPFPPQIPDPHQAVRDRFSADLAELARLYAWPELNETAAALRRSGEHIQTVTERATDYLLGDTAALKTIPALLQDIAGEEESAWRAIAA